MTLYFCLCCGQSVDGPESCMMPITSDAMAEWQAEIQATCQHTPTCTGPWAHAVLIIREEYAKAIAAQQSTAVH